MTQVYGKPAVLAVNGPARSGKSWIVENILEKLIPDAIVKRVTDEIFGQMVQDGKIPDGMGYADFKAQPDGRKQLIEESIAQREKDPNIYSRRLTDSATYKSSRVIIVDNIGYAEELKWFARNSYPLLVLRLDAPLFAREPFKSHSRRRYSLWADDCRSPVFYHDMLTAYDSIQMAMLLRWLTSPTLTREEAGPYNEIRELWIQYFATREATGDLFGTRGGSRVMG